LGYDAQPSRAAPYLRIALAFLKELGEKQLKQIPGVGPAVTALLELSKEADSKQLDARLKSLLAMEQETHEAISLLAAIASATLFHQTRILERMDAEGQMVAPGDLTDFAASAALLAYRNRIALDYLYTDYRGVQGVSRQEHVASLRMEDVYVMPRLIPETGSASDARGREETVLRELESQDLTPDERARLEEEYAVLTGMKWAEVLIDLGCDEEKVASSLIPLLTAALIFEIRQYA